MLHYCYCDDGPVILHLSRHPSPGSWVMQHVLLVVLTCNIVECRILKLSMHDIHNWFYNIFRNSYENKAGPFKPDTIASHLKDNISESGTVLL